MTASPTPVPPIVAKPPNYWLGFFLNWMLVGSGFSYLGVIGWHLGWLGLWVGGWLLSFGLALISRPLALVLALLLAAAFVVMLVQYRGTYMQLYGRGQTSSKVTDGLRWGLIGGHFALGFLMIPLIGILSAVLIPNLLNARKVAMERAHQASVRAAYQTAMGARIDGPLKVTDCLHSVGRFAIDVGPDALSCTINNGASDHPNDLGVTVTFKDGSTSTYP